jgi:hypothetical protein
LADPKAATLRTSSRTLVRSRSDSDMGTGCGRVGSETKISARSNK